MQKNQDNRTKAVGFTVVLHVMLAAALILGIEFSDYHTPSGPRVDIVEAELVTTPVKPKPRVDPEIERRKREEAEASRRLIEEQEKQKAEQELAAQAREQQEQLEKQAEAAARKKEQAKAEAKRKADLEAKKKTELANKKKAEEAKRRQQAEEEAKRKSEAEQQAREDALQNALAEEQRERELNPLLDAYRSAIGQKIAQNWLQPPSISTDLRCLVRVVQLPDGSVTSATISKSSGNSVFDESVIRAIHKASPLPQPPRPDVFDREVDVAFCSTGEAC